MKASTVSRWWSQAKQLWVQRPRWLTSLEAFRKLIVDLGVTVVIVVFLLGVLQHVMDVTPTIEPIAVPKQLADLGYSGDVVAAHLIDKARDIERRTNAGLSPFSAAAAAPAKPGPLMTITMPGYGISLGAIVDTVQRLLGLPSRLISGDIVSEVQDGQTLYRLTIRVGDPVPRSFTGGSQPSIDLALEDGAESLTRVLRPCAAAALLFYKIEADEIDRLIKSCFDDPKRRDREWAHNLRGLRLFAEGKYDDAIRDYDEAIRLHPGYANAIANRDAALKKQALNRPPTAAGSPPQR